MTSDIDMTVTLFAALDYLSGKVFAIDRQAAPELELHLICDN
jgi:hypothetical protein